MPAYVQLAQFHDHACPDWEADLGRMLDALHDAGLVIPSAQKITRPDSIVFNIRVANVDLRNEQKFIRIIRRKIAAFRLGRDYRFRFPSSTC
jgi:hypothetical protein